MSRIVYAALLLAAAPMSYAATTGPQGVPEVDGTGALAAIGLLAGVVAMIAERRRRS